MTCPDNNLNNDCIFNVNAVADQRQGHQKGRLILKN